MILVDRTSRYYCVTHRGDGYAFRAAAVAESDVQEMFLFKVQQKLISTVTSPPLNVGGKLTFLF